MMSEYDYHKAIQKMGDTFERYEELYWARIKRWSLYCSGTLMILVATGMYGCPQYRVWQQGLEGEAELRRAQQNRQIAIAQAEAKLEASSSLAKAEVVRANGVAQANKIIGDSLKDNEAYLRYLWIDNIAERKGDTIYIPTEAGMPLLEANRMRREK